MSLPVLRLPKRVYPRVPKSIPIMEQYPLYALSFNGINGYMIINDSLSLQVDYITMMALVRTPNVAPAEKNIIRTSNGASGLYAIRFDTSVFQSFIRDSAGTLVYANGVGTPTLVNNAWYFCAATYDGAFLKTYLASNGAPLSLVQTVPGTGLGLGNNPTLGVYIGAKAWVAPFFFGNILLPSLYNRALSFAELQRNMRNLMNPIRNGLVLFTSMIEGIGLNVADYSGQGNNGTLIGGVSWYEMSLYEALADIQ